MTKKGIGFLESRICRILLFSIVLLCVSQYLFAKGFFLQKVVIKERSSNAKPHILSLASSQKTIKDTISAAYEDFLLNGPFVNKTLIALVDSLRYDIAIDIPGHPMEGAYKVISKYINYTEEEKRNAVCYKFISDPPSITAPKVISLTTGALPQYVEGVSRNIFKSQLEYDSLVYQMNVNNLNPVYLGLENSFPFIYPGLFKREFLNSFTDWYDTKIMKYIESEMDKEDWRAIYMHFGTIDTTAHTYKGATTTQMGHSLSKTGKNIQRIINHLDSNTQFISFGDHGMDADGTHGGVETRLQKETILFSYHLTGLTFSNWEYNPDLAPNFIDLLKFLKKKILLPRRENKSNRAVSLPLDIDTIDGVPQIDLVPTIATNLHIPIPMQNLGKLIPGLLKFPDNLTISEVYYYLTFAYLNNYAQTVTFIKEFKKESKGRITGQYEESHAQKFRKLIHNFATNIYSKQNSVVQSEIYYLMNGEFKDEKAKENWISFIQLCIRDSLSIADLIEENANHFRSLSGFYDFFLIKASFFICALTSLAIFVQLLVFYFARKKNKFSLLKHFPFPYYYPIGGFLIFVSFLGYFSGYTDYAIILSSGIFIVVSFICGFDNLFELQFFNKSEFSRMFRKSSYFWLGIFFLVTRIVQITSNSTTNNDWERKYLEYSLNGLTVLWVCFFGRSHIKSLFYPFLGMIAFICINFCFPFDNVLYLERTIPEEGHAKQVESETEQFYDQLLSNQDLTAKFPIFVFFILLLFILHLKQLKGISEIHQHFLRVIQGGIWSSWICLGIYCYSNNYSEIERPELTFQQLFIRVISPQLVFYISGIGIGGVICLSLFLQKYFYKKNAELNIDHKIALALLFIIIFTIPVLIICVGPKERALIYLFEVLYLGLLMIIILNSSALTSMLTGCNLYYIMFWFFYETGHSKRIKFLQIDKFFIGFEDFNEIITPVIGLLNTFGSALLPLLMYAFTVHYYAATHSSKPSSITYSQIQLNEQNPLKEKKVTISEIAQPKKKQTIKLDPQEQNEQEEGKFVSVVNVFLYVNIYFGWNLASDGIIGLALLKYFFPLYGTIPKYLFDGVHFILVEILMILIYSLIIAFKKIG